MHYASAISQPDVLCPSGELMILHNKLHKCHLLNSTTAADGVNVPQTYMVCIKFPFFESFCFSHSNCPTWRDTAVGCSRSILTIRSSIHNYMCMLTTYQLQLISLSASTAEQRPCLCWPCASFSHITPSTSWPDLPILLSGTSCHACLLQI